MKNSIYTLILVFTCSISAFTQQLPQYSEYNMNEFVLNPAVAGAQDFIEVKAGYRNQWVNFEDSPTTYYISADMPLGKEISNRTHVNQGNKINTQGRYHKNKGFHGVGVYAINDVTGPTRRTWAYGAYSYHIPLANNIYASLGVFLGVKQFVIDGTQLTTAQGGDPLIGRYMTESLPDAVAGTWIYSDKFYIGLSAQQLIGNKLGFDPFNGTGDGRLNRHYFLTSGYNIRLSDDFHLVPSVLLKYVNPAPLSFDVNAKVRYRDLAWAGVSYRYNSAVSLMAGVVVKERIEIGYAFDFTTSDIRTYSSGTHEIIVGLRIHLPGQVICPGSFW